MYFKSSETNKGKKSFIHDGYMYIVLTCSENSYDTWRRQLRTNVKQKADEITLRPFEVSR